jgi:hypothetical protein
MQTIRDGERTNLCKAPPAASAQARKNTSVAATKRSRTGWYATLNVLVGTIANVTQSYMQKTQDEVR